MTWIMRAGILALLLMPLRAYAFGSSDDRGTAGFKGLQMISDARATALGGATVALPGHAGAYRANPASAAGIDQRTAAVTVTSHVSGVLPGGAVVLYPTRHGVWTASFNGVSYGDFDRLDEFAGEQGTFSAGDAMLHVAWARTLRYGFSAGISTGFIRSSIDAWTASAMVFGFGVMWTSPGGSFALGLSGTNFGSAISEFDGVKDKVPSAWHAGAMLRPAHFPVPLTLLAEARLPRDDDAALSVGAELNPVELLTFRVGYNGLIRYQNSTDDHNQTQTKLSLDNRESGNWGGLGLSAGVGLTWHRYGLDYTYRLASSFGGIHSIMLSLGW